MATQARTSPLNPIRDVQRSVNRLHALNDGMIAGGGELLTKMAEAGQAARMSPEDGQKALDATIAWLAGLAAVRQQGIDAHSELRAAVGGINLREMGFGDFTGCPDASIAKEDEVRALLRVVGGN